MTKILNIKSTILLIVFMSVATWFIITFLKSDEPVTAWHAIKALPTTAGYVTIVLTLFANHLWRLPIFKGWLVLIPDLNGTWEGELRSEWIDPATNQKVAPMKAYLVIRQTLFRTYCTQITAESKSYSRAVTIQPTPDNNLRTLEFTYANTPRISVQHRSHAHEGACNLEIISVPERKLVGKYWTERGSKGELEFKYMQKERLQEFL